jgi:glutathione S-transferase
VYRLHIANKNYSSWSLRPWVLMRELDIEFEEQMVVFTDPETNRAAFRSFSPSGRVPCLVDGPVTVWDSLAIVEYLAERHPGVWPADPVARAWARCAAAEMHSGFAVLRDRCSMSCGIRASLREVPPALSRDLERLVELWNEGLARFGGPFLAGSAFTAVDAFFAPVAFRVQTYGLPLAGPAADYCGRLLDMPAMRQWYDEALREPWREEAHEAEILGFSELIEDLRVAV